MKRSLSAAVVLNGLVSHKLHLASRVAHIKSPSLEAVDCAATDDLVVYPQCIGGVSIHSRTDKPEPDNSFAHSLFKLDNDCLAAVTLCRVQMTGGYQRILAGTCYGLRAAQPARVYVCVCIIGIIETMIAFGK